MANKPVAMTSRRFFVSTCLTTCTARRVSLRKVRSGPLAWGVIGAQEADQAWEQNLFVHHVVLSGQDLERGAWDSAAQRVSDTVQFLGAGQSSSVDQVPWSGTDSQPVM